MADTVIRFVVTHLDGKTGARTLALPKQGRHTWATAAGAQAWVDAAVEVNSPERLDALFGMPLEVRPVDCWPGHHDPKTCWFD